MSAENKCHICGEPRNMPGKLYCSAAHSLVAMPCSAAVFVVTQDLVDEIVRHAKNSQMGLGDQENSVSLDNYEPPHTTETLALLLVSAWSAKYDLVSVFCAAMDVLKEKQQNH